MRAAVGGRSLDTTMTMSTFHSYTLRQTIEPQNIHSYNRARLIRLFLPHQTDVFNSSSINTSHHTTHHGTKPSNQRAGTFPRSVKVGHISSRSCRFDHPGYLGHSHLRLWRAAPDTKHPESARRCSIPQPLHTARAVRLGYLGRIPRYVSSSGLLTAHQRLTISQSQL